MSLLLLPPPGGGSIDSGTTSLVVPPGSPYTAAVEYVLCDSESMERIGDMPQATARTLRLVWKGSGAATFVLDFDDDVAPYVSPITTCLKVIVDDVTYWSGPVWRREGGATTRKLAVSCVGWKQAQDKRTLHAARSYAAQYDHDVIEDLLDVVNAQDPVHPLRLDYAGEIGSDFQQRTRTYQVYQKLGAAINELENVEAGCDVIVDPDTKEVYAQAWDAWTDHPDMIFEALVDPQFSEDAEHFSNSFTATGTTGTAAGFFDDEDSINEYGRCDEVVALSDVADSTLLAAYAAEEVTVQSRGAIDPVARPLLAYNTLPSGASSDPQIFRDFNIGEGVRFSADFGLFAVDKQAVRVFALGLSFNENDDIKITEMQTSASST